MPDLCGDEQQKRKGEKKELKKAGGPLAHLAHPVPPPLPRGR